MASRQLMLFFMLLSPARGRGGVRGQRTSIPPHLTSLPGGGEEYEKRMMKKGRKQ
jgi:hypothetical protein